MPRPFRRASTLLSASAPSRAMPAGVRLNFGCGTHRLAGFVNIDIIPSERVDVVADVGGKLPFEDGTAELIYASHVLEHFPTDEVPGILEEWRRVLCEGGALLLAVPDLEIIARLMVERKDWFTPPHSPWLGAIYGGQKDEFDFHRTGFTLPWLAALLGEAGFGSVERVNWFREVSAPDLSRAELPFGVNISLNVRAIAGGSALPRRDLEQSPAERLFEVVDKGLALALRSSVALRSRLMARRRARLESTLRGD